MIDPSAPRRRKGQITRDAIIEVARVRFMNAAYEQVSIRDIAAEAGVDPALVIRHFGSKEDLFAEVLTTQIVGPGQALVGDRETFGARLARSQVQLPAQEHYEVINTAIWSAASPVAAKIVGRDVEERFVKSIAAALDGPDAEVRAALIVAILMGTSIMRNMLSVSPLADKDVTKAIPYLGAVLQHLADGD